MANEPAHKNPVIEVVEYIGLLKLVGAMLFGLISTVVGITVAWSSKADADDYVKHVIEEKERLHHLERKQDVLDAMQRLSISQQEKVESKLDAVLQVHGHPVPSSTPISLPTPVPSPKATP